MLSIFLDYELKQCQEKYIAICQERKEYDGIHSLQFILKTITSKYAFYKLNIDVNIFLTSTIKTFIKNIFLRAMQKYTILKNTLIYYNNKKKKSYNHVDLNMNPFVNKRHIIYFIDKRRKYTFHLHDLSNIIINALIYSDEYLFSIPTDIKNPYTNIKFTTEQMYIFYICMQLRGFYIHPLITMLMQENFVVNAFSIKYESSIKEYIIDNKIKNFTPKNICDELKLMFDAVSYNHAPHNQSFTISFINKLPNSILLHFKPLLYHYFRHIYSNNSLYRKMEYNKLVKKLIAFKKENPDFMYDMKIQTSIHNVNYKDIIVPTHQIGFIEAILYMQEN